MPDETLTNDNPRRRFLSAPLAPLKISVLAISFSAFSGAALGAELHRSRIEPPATVTEITGVNTKHARAKAKFTEPDIVKARDFL